MYESTIKFVGPTCEFTNLMMDLQKKCERMMCNMSFFFLAIGLVKYGLQALNFFERDLYSFPLSLVSLNFLFHSFGSDTVQCFQLLLMSCIFNG
jgi:hypothetical protein